MKNDNPWIAICPGIQRQTVANGKTMYQMLATLEPGSKMPAHQHPQEQIVHILSGRMNLIVDGTAHEMKTGDSFYRSEEHTSELQSRVDLVCRLLLEKKKHK